MTREERAREALAVQYEAHGYKHVARAVRRNTHALASPIIAAAMVQFADAEAAAMRERAAVECEKQAAIFLSPEYASGQPFSSISERFACAKCAQTIRALPATGEVGRG